MHPYRPNTVHLTDYAITLNSKDDLLPGDTLNNRKWGNDGHVVMFVQWLNKSAGTFTAFEEHGGVGAVQTTRTLVKNSKGWSIVEYAPSHDPWFLERKRQFVLIAAGPLFYRTPPEPKLWEVSLLKAELSKRGCENVHAVCSYLGYDSRFLRPLGFSDDSAFG